MNTHFDWGIGPNNEPQYGLWSPVLDRFLLVLCDKEFGTTIKYLSSSRYSLYLVDLSTSSNYEAGMIDNSCCSNWTIANKKDIKLSRPQDYDLVDADLVATNAVTDWDIDSEQQWLQFMWSNLKYLRVLKNSNSWYNYSKFLSTTGIIGAELSSSNSFYNDVTLIENYILKLLYLGDDINDTNHAIESYIDQLHPLIKLSK